MINIRNIIKVFLVAMFICTCSLSARASFTPPAGGCPGGSVWNAMKGECVQESSIGKSNTPTTSPSSNTQQDATFCGDDKGVFSELIMTGQKIFNRLRDLIYVTAGFGMIASAVGGFFGNLNWKWLGAIVISLVVIATAGELIVMLTGCEQYGTSLITNTLSEPAQVATPVE